MPFRISRVLRSELIPSSGRPHDQADGKDPPYLEFGGGVEAFMRCDSERYRLALFRPPLLS